MNGWQTAFAIIGSVTAFSIAIALAVGKVWGGGIKGPCDEKFKEHSKKYEGIMSNIKQLEKTEGAVDLLRQEIGWIKGRMTEFEKSLGKIADKIQLIYIEMPKRKSNHNFDENGNR